MPAPALASPPNVAAGAASGAALLEVSGPELAAAGDRDWVQLVLWSNDGMGDTSRLEFRTVDTLGNSTVSLRWTRARGHSMSPSP